MTTSNITFIEPIFDEQLNKVISRVNFSNSYITVVESPEQIDYLISERYKFLKYKSEGPYIG